MVCSNVVIVEPIVTPSLVVNSKVKPLLFVFAIIPFTPPQIGVGPKITLISIAFHA
jgi:hypothetical protein